MVLRGIGGAFALLLALGSATAATAGEQQRIFDVAADDAEMNAAKARAIASLPTFYQRLADPAADEGEFMVKFDIVPGDEVEFVWATDLDRSRVPMTGTLINEPELSAHRPGDRVAIAEGEIIDWTYRKGRVMQGGFTNRVLIERMPPELAAQYRAQLGW